MRSRYEGARRISSRVDCCDNGVRDGRWRNYQMIDCVSLILSILLILSKLFAHTDPSLA
jgi:hypothetical protein